MKIFNIENGIKNVYVQYKDIMMLFNCCDVVPASIFEKVFSSNFVVNEDNEMNFVKFSLLDEVKFFESLDFIVDYKKVRDLSHDDIILEVKNCLGEINELSGRYDSLMNDEEIYPYSLVRKIRLLDYKVLCFKEIISMGEDKLNSLLPVVPDSDGFSFYGDDSCDYIMRSSFDSNKIMIYRKDGNRISDNEIISPEFFYMGISKAIMCDEKKDRLYYDKDGYFVDDNQYFVVELKDKEHVHCDEKSSVKKVLKRVFGISKK